MLEISIGDKKFSVEKSPDPKTVLVNNEALSVDLVNLEKNHHHLILDGRSYRIEVIIKDPKNPELKINGTVVTAEVKNETDLLLERLGINVKSKKVLKELKAPMPGLVLSVKVSEGEEVSEGQPLVVLEAMKMENVLKSPGKAVVEKINVKQGEAIEKNAVLITFK
ncbi:MAG: acetyl-CoA carboxylase biotin carboxyl carrier protein subunit [Salibacteraceae bacterium]